MLEEVDPVHVVQVPNVVRHSIFGDDDRHGVPILFWTILIRILQNFLIDGPPPPLSHAEHATSLFYVCFLGILWMSYVGGPFLQPVDNLAHGEGSHVEPAGASLVPRRVVPPCDALVTVQGDPTLFYTSNVQVSYQMNHLLTKNVSFEQHNNKLKQLSNIILNI